ncbi:MAG: hypothetical protein RSC66_00645 [Comamonas sp.]
MHLFNEAQWRRNCEQAMEFADFCTAVSAQVWKRKLDRIALLDAEVVRISGEHAINVADLSAALAATVWNHKLHETMVLRLQEMPLEHQVKAQAIAREYGYIHSQELRRRSFCQQRRRDV